MNQKKKIILGIGLVILIIVIFFIFYFIKKANESAKNEEAIRVVTEQIFTCPNEEMIKLYIDMQNVADKTELGVHELNTKEIENKIYEMYAPYISDDWYESFVEKFFAYYLYYSVASEYETKVNKVAIIQHDKKSDNYSFVVSLNYGPIDGVKEDIEIEGRAQFAKEAGKITYIKYSDDVLLRTFLDY